MFIDETRTATTMTRSQAVQPQRTSVCEAIEAAGADLMFLPPSGSDVDPILKAFACVKAMLRRAGERTVARLSSLIGRLADPFRTQECATCFISCG